MASGSVVRLFLTLGFLAIVFRDYIKVTTLMHHWSREFSKMGVLSTASTFPYIEATAENYVNRIGQPLYVVTLNGLHTPEEFGNVTSRLGAMISYATWLVIFLEAAGTRPHKQFCMNPTGNKFNLRFDTIMLVLCYDMPVLREWYSMHDNVTRTFDYAMWNPEKAHLEVLTPLHMYSRRDNMFNETLRIAILNTSTVVKIKDNELSGPFGMIFMELSKTLNFSIKILKPLSAYGSWSRSKKTWSGVIGQLANNEADIGLGGFTMANKRMDVVDFALPLIHTRNRVYLRQPDGGAVRWAAYFQAFDIRLWTTLIVLLMISPLVLTWMKKNLPADIHKNKDTYTVMSESYTGVWGLYCQQGLAELTTRDSLRVAYFAISISALIVYSAYSASLISFLTVFVPSMPFTTLRGFVNDGSYKLIVFRHSADSDMFKLATNNILADMNKLMKNTSELPLSAEDGFKQVCAGKVGFYTSTMVNKRTLYKRKCHTVSIETGRVESLAIALTKNSPYTGLINYHLQKFLDSGILDRIKGSQFKRIRNSVIVHPSATVWGVAPILAVAFGGLVLSLFFLGFEILFFWFRKKRHRGANQCWGSDKDPEDRNFSHFSKQVNAIDTKRTYRLEYLS